MMAAQSCPFPKEADAPEAFGVRAKVQLFYLLSGFRYSQWNMNPLARGYRGKPDVFIRFPKFTNLPQMADIIVAHPLGAVETLRAPPQEF